MADKLQKSIKRVKNQYSSSSDSEDDNMVIEVHKNKPYEMLQKEIEALKPKRRTKKTEVPKTKKSKVVEKQPDKPKSLTEELKLLNQ